jgi:hypothetical protein
MKNKHFKPLLVFAISFLVVTFGTIGLAHAMGFGFFSKSNVSDFWIGKLIDTSNNEEILIPELFTSSKNCSDSLAELNNASKSTIHVARQISCQTVLINTNEALKHLENK